MMQLEMRCEHFLQRACTKNDFVYVANRIIVAYQKKFSSFQIVPLSKNRFLTLEYVRKENNFFSVEGREVFFLRNEFSFGHKKCVNYLTHKEIYTALKKMVYAIKSL